ncbi:alpha/beta hydrolase [Streptacidiphilus sp. N1-12]|uniref:Alpha/beta hydrolase n=2 Tax=Streptacidiphilus alkalitolerans TaxID=3342712 RepID=A0ABV6WVG7_9ACTN
MSLTGTAFFYLLIAATAAAVVGTCFAWGAVRGPRPLRWGSRVVMIAVCQFTAIAVVAAWINNSYGLYTSWDDLLGRDNGSATAAMPGPPAGRAMFTRGSNGLLETYFHGAHSKLSGEVLAWTPPQYDEPAYRHQKFPVIMLLHGVPGSPQSWVEGGQVPGQLARMMESGMINPAILVIPVIDPGGIDTDCSDTPARKNATWIAQDVTQLIKSQFRALPEARGWGLVGLSTGGYCAVKLPMQYPGTFANGVALDPDPLGGDPSVLTNAKLREENSPLWLTRKRPDVSLFVATSAQDRLSRVANLTALRKDAKWPTTVAPPLVLPTGGHNWNTWLRMYPVVFPWLSSHLDRAHVVAPSKPQKHPAGSGSTGAAGVDPSAPAERKSAPPRKP